MAAGLGFKTFTTGEVLTAADVNGYLMQGVLVFASEAARDAAITSPQEGQFAYTKDNNSLWYYTGSAWASSGATGDIEGVTAGVGISGGGTSGTVTITNSMATAIDAKGDLVAGTGADTFSRLAVGSNDQVLIADSTTATGLKWGTAEGALALSTIASGSLNSGTSLTLSSLSSYDTLIVVLNGITWDSGNSRPTIKVNNNTGGNYIQAGAAINQNNVYGSRNLTATSINLGFGVAQSRTNTSNTYIATFTNCKAAGFTNVNASSLYTDGDSLEVSGAGQYIYKVAEAVSSLVIGTLNDYTFNGTGTYQLIGA